MKKRATVSTTTISNQVNTVVDSTLGALGFLVQKTATTVTSVIEGGERALYSFEMGGMTERTLRIGVGIKLAGSLAEFLFDIDTTFLNKVADGFLTVGFILLGFDLVRAIKKGKKLSPEQLESYRLANREYLNGITEIEISFLD